MLSRSDWPHDYFEVFWETYPRRLKRKCAERALKKVHDAREVPFEILISAVRAYARSVVGMEAKYVAHPASWINAGRWDDDPAALAGKVIAPSLPCANGGVLIRRGSPQAKAWQQYRGRDFPWGPSGVWMVASEWPPVCGND